jgi:Zn-dependent M28 family amino/carboxypeptidase
MDDDTLLGRAWTDDFPYEFLTRLIEVGPRLGGSPGEERAARLVHEALADVGAAPETRPFEADRWTRGHTRLAVETPGGTRTFEAIALPYSPAADVTAPLVDVGYGTPAEIAAADLDGSVALSRTDSPPEGRFYHRMEKAGLAAEAGAVGFVFTNHTPGQLPPTGALAFGEAAPLAGVGVSAETGAWLSEYDGHEVSLTVAATVEPATSQNVVVDLGEGREEVVLLAHHDAHDIAEGALDNGCGVAVVLGAARLLAEMDLGCRVRVATVGSEETGLLGSRALAAELDTDRVRAVVNVDGAGRARNLLAFTHGSAEVEALARTVIAGVNHPLSVNETPHPYSDHWHFLRRGVPSLQLHSESGDGGEQLGGGSRGRGWTHTAADTREKVDPRNLREHAAFTALLVRAFTREAVPRRAADALRTELVEADAEPGMRAAGIWPTDW